MERIELILSSANLIANIFVGIAIFYATYSAPLRALREQKNREKEEITRNNKLQIFYTLMSTRSQRLSYRHIEALNMIDIEYNGINSVTYAWSEYLHHLNVPSNSSPTWASEGDRLFINMLYEMSIFLGYSYTKLDIKNKCYSPQGHYEQELNQQEIQNYLADILSHRKAFPIIIKKDED